jgi:dihydroflavonol-4-reductase
MVLVTGGTGLVGAHLLLHLAAQEDSIRATYRQAYTIKKTLALFQFCHKEHLFTKIDWIQADITDIPALEIAFENVDYVYHCAAKISYDPNDENQLRKVNIEGTANIVNLCLDHAIKKLCHVSSIAALGDLAAHESVITEETEWNPEAPHSDYAISKHGAEMEIWRGQQEGLEVVIVNPGVIFGAGFWQQGSGAFFTYIQKGFPFYTKGTTAYVGVKDVVALITRLMNSSISGERFIIVAENLSFQKVIFTIADCLRVKRPKREAKPWMLAFAWRLDWLISLLFRTKRKLSKYSASSLITADFISNDKIKNALNFEFQSIEAVIKDVVCLQGN